LLALRAGRLGGFFKNGGVGFVGENPLLYLNIIRKPAVCGA